MNEGDQAFNKIVERFNDYERTVERCIARKIPEELRWDVSEKARERMVGISTDIQCHLPEKWSITVTSDNDNRSALQVRGPNCKNIKQRTRFLVFPGDYLVITADDVVRYAGHRLFETTHDLIQDAVA